MSESKYVYPHVTGTGFQKNEHDGITKREYFAAKALQGMLSYSFDIDYTSAAEEAILYSDALIKELEK